MKITAVVLTKNEEKNIVRTLNSISFCEEIIVIDDFSNDKTVELAKKNNAKIYERRLNNDFSSQRNFGLERSRGEWVLFLDADEEVSPGLAVEIENSIKAKPEKSAYYIKRRDYWWGRELKYGEVSIIRKKGLIRLARKSSGKWFHPVHEIFQTSSPVGKLNGFINHYPHPTVKDFLRDINYYSTLRAKELLKQGKKMSLVEIISYPLGKFIANYIFKLGFIDGPAGFIYSFMMSFHSFLVRAKLYQYMKVD
ncbi:glycosyltransferase family 2 protein [Candidatus Roizmanbacteria bacterium]|nr:glycosyltransferase family 2 protein [Candidatus Roizmanbacteria bacterium]